eukprot:GHVU01133525.1.p1 GENE.GHVU01133525.1~~GHVU01133525.1.p1  ORF type:complete len:699 (-),score=76.10 GHVU01133525.1:169-2076(-)
MTINETSAESGMDPTAAGAPGLRPAGPNAPPAVSLLGVPASGINESERARHGKLTGTGVAATAESATFEAQALGSRSASAPCHPETPQQGAQPPVSEFPPDVDAAVNPELSWEERKKYMQLLMDNRGIWEYPKVGTCKIAEHNIYIQPNTHPIREKLRKQNPALQQEVQKQLAELVQAGSIASGESDWACNIVVVPKKGDKWRICIDYRRLNAVTVKDSYPMQRIDDALRALEGSSIFGVIDLQAGYHQIPMAEDSRDYTAFITPLGLFNALVMMFGLTNAPRTFQRMVDRLFHDLRFKGVGAFVDDIVIYASSHPELRSLLTNVCMRLSAAGLYGNIKKISLGYTKFSYLGFVVDASGTHPDPEKVAAMKKLRVPRNPQEIRRFLGVIGFFRRFIRNCAEKARPLNKLLKKGCEWEWGETQQLAWEKLRDCLTTDPVVLEYPRPNWPFCVRTDASDEALGAALTQTDPDGGTHTIAYASHTLTDAERLWPPREKEAFAIFWGVTHFAQYLRGASEFTVRTDHESLQHLWSADHKRLTRWRIALQEYNFVIHYQQGSTNFLADLLSRDVTSIISEDDIDQRITLSPHIFLCLHSPLIATPAKQDIPAQTRARRRSDDSGVSVRPSEVNTAARPPG